MTTPTKRLTTDQRATVMSAVLIGNTLPEFAERHPDYPEGDLSAYWRDLAAEIDATTLKPGQAWAITSEWQ